MQPRLPVVVLPRQPQVVLHGAGRGGRLAERFILATAVFRGPLALTIFDEAHSEDEERWGTLSRTENGQLLVVVHTSEEVNATEWHIRIISARKADK